MSLADQTGVRVYPRHTQATGSFDGGRITEFKPIGFSGDGSDLKRVGPLFYWAWATATEAATIPMHPHKGFEILTYVLAGEVAHRDTAGNSTRVSAGGAQLMQTGSGVSHEESTAAGTELLQIWFEPDLRESLRQQPKYADTAATALPVMVEHGVRVTSVLGGRAPLQIQAAATLEHWAFAPGTTRSLRTVTDCVAVLVIEGELTINVNEPCQTARSGDFVVIDGLSTRPTELHAAETAEVVVVRVPGNVPYELLRK